MGMKQLVAAYERLGSLKAVSRDMQWTWHQTRKLYVQAVAAGLMEPVAAGRKQTRHGDKTAAPKVEGQVHAKQARSFALPAYGQVKRYLFSCAQNNTKLHTGLWTNLLALAAHYDAEIHISRFTYSKTGLGAAGDKAVAIKREVVKGADDMWWDPALVPYFSDDRAEIAPGLVWCGEMNILPTAARPLSSLESFTGRNSSIFPHVKLAMESVPTTRGQATKLIYTTGTVTQRNYIQRKAGLKAEFHHCYAALVVEVDGEGSWWVRQINADSDGNIQDLTTAVEGGIVQHRSVEAITWGDIHVAEADPGIHELAWSADLNGPGWASMLDVLQPRYQFLHDVLHFRGRSHHEVKNPHVMFRRYIQGVEDVRKEVRGVAEFLMRAERPWCTTVVVDSNHHHHLSRWLQEQDGRRDPVNAEFWLKLSQRVYEDIREQNEQPVLSVALNLIGFQPHTEILFTNPDEGFVICDGPHGGIECGMHGDLGPNGARGSANNLAKMGRRANIGHSHSARIVDGVYQSGTCGVLDPDWTHGPSSWSHSHIVVYPSGKRAILTMWRGKWRA